MSYPFMMRLGAWLLVVAAFAACSKGDAKSGAAEEKAEASAAPVRSGLSPSELQRLRSASTDDVKAFLAESKEHVNYRGSTLYVTLDHERYESVWVNIDAESGTPTNQVSLQFRTNPTAAEARTLADRLTLLHGIFRPMKVKTDDALAGTESYLFRMSGMNPFARLFMVSGKWTLIICSQFKAEEHPEICWPALDAVLTNRVQGVDPTCYTDDAACDRSKLATVERVVGEVMPSVELGRNFDLGMLVADGCRTVSLLDKSLTLSSTCEADDSETAPIVAKALAAAIGDMPAVAAEIREVVVISSRGKKSTVPI